MGVNDERGPLLRVLGTWFGIAAVIGSVIGVGILRVPSALAADLHQPVLFIGIWFVGAAVAALGANCVAELAVMLPKAGGPYVYIQRAYGDYAGFVAGWVDWFLSVGSAGFILVAIGEYGLRVAPAFPGGANGISVCAILLLFLIHAAGLRSGSGSQKLLSAAKATAFVALVLICFIGAARGDAVAEPVRATEHVAPWALLLVLGRSAVMINETYAGWNTPVYMTEENREPARSIPRAMFAGIAIVATIYVLMNLALLSVLPLKNIAESKLPIADAATLILGDAAGIVVTAIALVTLMSLCHANLFQAPRVLLALARDGWFHRAASTVTENGALLPGLAISATAMIVLALTGTFEQLFISIGLLGTALDGFTYSSVLRLRRCEPDLRRGYRAKGYPWLPIAVVSYVIIIVVATVYEDPTSAVRGGLALLASAPAYIWLRARQQRTTAGLPAPS
jgi:APA family basic amino acid/polyamine antiporter